MDLTVTAQGPTPPAEAWTAYVTPALWRRWAPHMPAVECGEEVIAHGSRGRFHIGPITLGRFVITHMDVGVRTWSWRVGVLGMTTTGTHTVTPTDRDERSGCRCSMTMTLPRPLALAYRPVAWWALRRLARFSAHGPADR